MDIWAFLKNSEIQKLQLRNSEIPNFRSISGCLLLNKRIQQIGATRPSFLPGETQTMVRVNCQNGDGGGSWVGEIVLGKEDQGMAKKRAAKSTPIVFELICACFR